MERFGIHAANCTEQVSLGRRRVSSPPAEFTDQSQQITTELTSLLPIHIRESVTSGSRPWSETLRCSPEATSANKVAWNLIATSQNNVAAI